MKTQQGDVLFTPSRKPKGAKKVKAKSGKYILREGEATGHAHVLAADKPIVSHEEHGTVLLPPGTHRIDAVREVDPYEGEIREVRD